MAKGEPIHPLCVKVSLIVTRSPPSHLANRNAPMNPPPGLSALEEAKWFRDNVQGKSGSKSARGGLASRGGIAKRAISSSNPAVMPRFPTASQLNAWPSPAKPINFDVPTVDKNKENISLRRPQIDQGYMAQVDIALAGSKFTTDGLEVTPQVTNVQKGGTPASLVSRQSSAPAPTETLEAGSSLQASNRDHNSVSEAALPSIEEQDMIEFQDSSVRDSSALDQSVGSVSQLITLGGSSQDNSGIAVGIHDDLQEIMEFFVPEPATVVHGEPSTEPIGESPAVDYFDSQNTPGTKAEDEDLPDTCDSRAKPVGDIEEETAVPVVNQDTRLVRSADSELPSASSKLIVTSIDNAAEGDLDHAAEVINTVTLLAPEHANLRPRSSWFAYEDYADSVSVTSRANTCPPSAAFEGGVGPQSDMVALPNDDNIVPTVPDTPRKPQTSHDSGSAPDTSTTKKPARTFGLASSRWATEPVDQTPVTVPAKTVAKKSGLSSSRWATESSTDTAQPPEPERRCVGRTAQAAIESFDQAEPSKNGISVEDGIITSKWAGDAPSNQLMPHFAPQRPLAATQFDMINGFRDGQDRQEAEASANKKLPTWRSADKYSAVAPPVAFISDVEATQCFTTAKEAQWRAKGKNFSVAPPPAPTAGVKQVGKHVELVERTMSWLNESTFADLGWQDGATSGLGEFSFWKTMGHSKEEEDDGGIPHTQESFGPTKLLTMSVTPAKKLRRNIALMECAVERILEKLKTGGDDVDVYKIKEQRRAILEQIQKLKQELGVMMDESQSHGKTEQGLDSVSKSPLIQPTTAEGENSASKGDLRESESSSSVRDAAQPKIDHVKEKESGLEEASLEMPDGRCMRSELGNSASHEPIGYAHSSSKSGDAVKPEVPMPFHIGTANTLSPRKAWFETRLTSLGLRGTSTGLSTFQREPSSLEKDWNLSDSAPALIHSAPGLSGEGAFESDMLISVSPQKEDNQASFFWRREGEQRDAGEPESGNLGWLSPVKNEVLELAPGTPLTVKGRPVQDDPFVNKSPAPMERTDKSKSKHHGEMGVTNSLPFSEMLTACQPPFEALDKDASTVRLSAETNTGESVYASETKQDDRADRIAISRSLKGEPVAERVEVKVSSVKKLTSKRGLSSSRWATNEADDRPKASGDTNGNAANTSEIHNDTLPDNKDKGFPAATFNGLLLSQITGVKEPATASTAVSKAKSKTAAETLKRQMSKDISYREFYAPQTATKDFIAACSALTLSSPAPPPRDIFSSASSLARTVHCARSPEVTHQAPFSSYHSAIAFAHPTSQQTTFMDVAAHTIPAPVTRPTSLWAMGMVPDSKNPSLIRSVECILDGAPWAPVDSPGTVHANVTVLENGRMVKSMATLTAPPWDEHNNLWHAELFMAKFHTQWTGYRTEGKDLGGSLGVF